MSDGTLYGIDAFTLITFVTITLAYCGLTYWAAYRLGSSFDERYKIVTAMATAYIIVIGAWRFLDQRARDVAHELVAERQGVCVAALRAAGELTADYRAKVYAESVDDKDVSLSASEFQQQFAQSPLLSDAEVETAMDQFSDVAAHDNWGRNLNRKANDANSANEFEIQSNCLEDATENLADACQNMLAKLSDISFFSRGKRPIQKSPLASTCLRG